MTDAHKLFTKLFWLDAGERMVVTAAQVMLSIVTIFLPAITVANGESLQTAVALMVQTAPFILLAGVGGAFYALLKAVIAAYKNKTDTASLVVDTKELKQ